MSHSPKTTMTSSLKTMTTRANISAMVGDDEDLGGRSQAIDIHRFHPKKAPS